MSKSPDQVLVVGAAGSIGRLVVAEAIREGYAVRALVRDLDRARGLPSEAQRIVGDLARPETLVAAVDGVDAIVFTHGSNGGGKVGAENIDYGGVRNVLAALGNRKVRIALMTAIGVTNRTGAYNRSTEAHDWKRRGERLVRASGMPYTIVRPGLVRLQRRRPASPCAAAGRHPDSGQSQRWRRGTPPDCRDPGSELAVGCRRAQDVRTRAERGPASDDFDALFAALEADPPGALDAVSDAPNMPLAQEPERVREAMRQLTAV